MAKPRTLANTVSTGSVLEDGIVSASEITGSFPDLTVTGNLTVDTDTLFVNSATNSVGIGTVTPNIGSWGRAVTLQGATNAAFEVTDGVARGAFAAFGSAAVAVSAETNHPLAFYTNAIERARITSAGDIGIGTTVPSAKLDVSGELIATSYNETFATLSGTTPAVNCETGNVFALTTSGNTTFTFTNPPATGTAYGFTLKITAGGTHTLTWPASVDWAGGTAPDAPASGEVNIYVFYTHDGGTNWYGFLSGGAMA